MNVVAIAQGSSELNITVAIDREEVAAALNTLHAEFQLDRMRALGEADKAIASLELTHFRAASFVGTPGKWGVSHGAARER